MRPCLRIQFIALSILLCLGLINHPILAGGVKPAGLKGWSFSHVFDNRVIIENKGQFDGKTNVPGEKVLFGARCGKMDIYFTPSGICYRHDELKHLDQEELEALEHSKNKSKLKEASEPVIQTLHATWTGANPSPRVTSENKLGYYYTYPSPNKTTLQATVYKKIVYHDLYPGIDAEYLLSDDKEGLKYSLIIHPGADIGLVKLKYSGNHIHMNRSGDLILECEIGEVTDHAPLSFYESDKKPVKSAFVLDADGQISFSIKGGYDHSLTLVIDPWTTNPNFTSYNSGYDLEFDNNGNVYVYGGWSPFQLEKFNNAGVLQWVYNATPISGNYYGDVATDEISGTSYLIEGYNIGTGAAQVIKVNTLGAQTGLYPGKPALDEMWRADYDACDKQIVIGCGGTSGQNQTAMLDTNMVSLTFVNSIATTDNGYHDICLLATDPSGGFCYMATTRSLSYATYDNVMFKVPVPALAPSVFQVPDGYAIREFSGLAYVNNQTGYNGFNGMACSLNFLYTYDGSTLKKWNKNTGVLLASVTTGGTIFATGGLAVDVCDHVYAGTNSVINEYDVNLAPIGSFPVSNTVYDVKLGPNNKLLATGIGFVQQIDLAGLVPLAVTTTSTPAGCTCTGTANASVTLCGAATTVQYLWTPGGQTTSSVSNLCAGTYTVAVTPSCALTPVSTTIVVTGGAGSLTLTSTQTNVLCNGGSNGSATVTATGTAPFIYSWTPSGGTGATATGLAAGTYTATVTDNTGCTGTTTVTITQPVVLSATNTSVNETCNGGSTGSITVTPAGGTTAYTYAWTPSGGTGPTASTLAAGAFTCTVTDANGCTTTSTATITQPTPIVLTTTNTPSNCAAADGSTSVTATGGTGAYTYSWSPSGGNGTTAPNLIPGTYTVTVNDANNCIQTGTTVVGSNGSLSVTAVSTNVSCFGGSDGTATATPVGGTAPYTYAWTPAGGTAATATGLGIGTFTITAKDANGCQAQATVIVSQPSALVVTIPASTSISCNGGNNGTATGSATGGTPVGVH